MARLNIEDQFWDEVADLILALGDKDRAYGMALRFFRECQKLFKQGRPMSEDQFKAEGFSESLFPKFARRVPGGIAAAGAEKHFAWLEQKAEAGRKGGKSRSPAKIRHLKQNRSESEAEPKQTVTEPKQTEASYSSSPSFSLSSSSSGSSSKNLPTTSQAKSSGASGSSEIWEAYRKAYVSRYKTEPVRNATVNAQIKNLTGRLARDEAPLVAEFYVWHNDAFYVRALHPVGLLLKDAEALRTQWARGRAITGTDAKSVERMQANANAFSSAFADLDRKRESNV